MKGLRKYMPPFAPDQSGACSVLYDLGGIIAICDAGGCTGNVCGFDEPRWFTRKSAIFSAGLRDMDAILGRDDKLVQKLADAAGKLDAGFAAIVGTPVPAVIATDYHALQRMAERKVKLPIMTVDTTGMVLYDVGAEKAYDSLFRTFAEKTVEKIPGTVAVLGATPLDLTDLDAGEKMVSTLRSEGWQQVWCYGMGAGLEEVRQAGGVERNIVAAPCALKAAQYLEKTFGTPYEVRCPMPLPELPDCEGKKVLIVHQQVIANELRRAVLDKGAEKVTVASWFMLKKELKQAGDIHLTEEDQFEELLKAEDWDVIIADDVMRRAARSFQGIWVSAPHFAASGRMP